MTSRLLILLLICFLLSFYNVYGNELKLLNLLNPRTVFNKNQTDNYQPDNVMMASTDGPNQNESNTLHKRFGPANYYQQRPYYNNYPPQGYYQPTQPPQQVIRQIVRIKLIIKKRRTTAIYELTSPQPFDAENNPSILTTAAPQPFEVENNPPILTTATPQPFDAENNGPSILTTPHIPFPRNNAKPSDKCDDYLTEKPVIINSDKPTNNHQPDAIPTTTQQPSFYNYNLNPHNFNERFKNQQQNSYLSSNSPAYPNNYNNYPGTYQQNNMHYNAPNVLPNIANGNHNQNPNNYQTYQNPNNYQTYQNPNNYQTYQNPIHNSNNPTNSLANADSSSLRHQPAVNQQLHPPGSINHGQVQANVNPYRPILNNNVYHTMGTNYHPVNSNPPVLYQNSNYNQPLNHPASIYQPYGPNVNNQYQTQQHYPNYLPPINSNNLNHNNQQLPNYNFRYPSSNNNPTNLASHPSNPVTNYQPNESGYNKNDNALHQNRFNHGTGNNLGSPTYTTYNNQPTWSGNMINRPAFDSNPNTQTNTPFQQFNANNATHPANINNNHHIWTK